MRVFPYDKIDFPASFAILPGTIAGLFCRFYLLP